MTTQELFTAELERMVKFNQEQFNSEMKSFNEDPVYGIRWNLENIIKTKTAIEVVKSFQHELSTYPATVTFEQAIEETFNFWNNWLGRSYNLNQTGSSQGMVQMADIIRYGSTMETVQQISKTWKAINK